ncbi:Uncharacterised protein [uncultured archaeon]|nr:Uncharacterised protein [uncultured archaeon]
MLIGLAYADSRCDSRLAYYLKYYHPGKIGIQGTQKEIDAMMENASKKGTVQRWVNILNEKYPGSNSDTICAFARAETGFYNLLCRKKEKSRIPIIGCSEAGFPSDMYKDEIDECIALRDAFTKKVLKLPLKEAEEVIQMAYDEYDPLSPANIKSRLPDKLVAYYETQDKFAVKRIFKEAANDEESSFLYLCDITHIDILYKNMLEILFQCAFKDLGVSICPIVERLCDADSYMAMDRVSRFKEL